MGKIKKTIAFLVLSAVILVLRNSHGSTPNYCISIITIFIFWYLMGLKIGTANIRTILIISITIASVIALSHLIIPPSSQYKTMGVIKEMELDPSQIGLLSSSHKKALQMHFDKEPISKDRYIPMGSLRFSENGINYSEKIKNLKTDKLPKTTEWVEKNLTSESIDKDTEKIKELFSSNQFQYSLSPPKLKTQHPLDEFLFETKSGFCEHYSAALCTMLNLAGGKARVMYGYSGGEWNQFFKTLTYFDSDAHAWVEIYDNTTKTFKTIDPTAWVNPEISQHKCMCTSTNYTLLVLVLVLMSITFIIIIVTHSKEKENSIEIFTTKIESLEDKNNLNNKGITLSERLPKIIECIKNPLLKNKMLDSLNIYMEMYDTSKNKEELNKLLKKSLKKW